MSDDVDAAGESLAGKLRTLDLDPAERAVLAEILERAKEANRPDVEGFAMPDQRPTGTVGGMPGVGLGFKGSDEELQVLIDWLGEPRG